MDLSETSQESTLKEFNNESFQQVINQTDDNLNDNNALEATVPSKVEQDLSIFFLTFNHEKDKDID